jgi:hypothetical protein
VKKSEAARIKAKEDKLEAQNKEIVKQAKAKAKAEKEKAKK